MVHVFLIGHFRVRLCLCFKTSPRAKRVMKMSLIRMKINPLGEHTFLRIVSHEDWR